MTVWTVIEQIAQMLFVLMGLIWTIIVFFHTLAFPISEDKMRQIIREEVKKILLETEQ